VPEVSRAEFRSSVPSEDPGEFGPDGRLNPRAVVAALDRILPAERSVVMDGGHFIGWAPMYLTVPDPHAMVLVGTAFQSIGLGFGSAAGVSVARPERTTVLVSGDGGGLMGLADFETFLRATRKGVVVVLNDSAYGAELHQYAAKGLHDQAMLIDEVDFAAVGRALGAQGAKARTLADLGQLQEWLGSRQEGVYVLDVAISQKVVAEFMAESVAAKG
jgi:thiamine pyrophosphate-dependent acetolactate synthase large subunit-like protein